MKVTRGPLIDRYADTFGLQVGDVLAWVAGYINYPETFPALAAVIEPSEPERATSIRAYMQSEVESSVSGRIKQQQETERKAA